MTIVKIHGCSGSGKTTMIRALFDRAVLVEPTMGPGDVPAYHLSLYGKAPTFVLGSYESNCGGVDTIPAAWMTMDLIDYYAPRGNVVFEGLLQSTYYGAMGAHSQRYGEDYVYAFLRTSLAMCQGNVILRREKNGTKRGYNPELNVAKFVTINRLRQKLLDRNIHVVANLDNVDQLIGMLK
jgi:hypothetical protein